MSLHHFRSSRLVQMVFLFGTLSATLGNPVSSPEIANIKSGKSTASVIVGSANSLQQQQQKSSPQDAHLNSLTVFATNFDSITSGNPQQQQQSGNFKPSYNYNTNSNSNNNNNNNNYNSNSNTNNNYNSNSNYNTNNNANSNYNSNSNNNNNDNFHIYNAQNHNSYMPLPEIETNFTPMQQTATIQTSSDISQPVIMQYLPQTVQSSDGIQYLQLIPTRPLMVPIGSYITGGPTGGQVAADVGTTVSNNVGYHHHNHHPPSIAATNTIAEYASRPPILSPQLPANGAAPSTPVLLDIPATHPYGLQTYAPQMLHPYRNYRINREIKPKHLPPGMSLNMHEYMPSPHDPPRASFVRGRP